MKQVLRAPHSRPHACTDIRYSPYASIRAMNAPARKLLKQEKAIKASRPGTPCTTRKVPRRSTLLCLG